VLLGLFIAYPFVKGVELSVTDTKVGVAASFVGLQNFAALANDSIFRTAVWNVEYVRLYGGDHSVQARARPLAGAAAQPALQGQGDNPRLHPAALHHSDKAILLASIIPLASLPLASAP
jgi:hypothetical protein